MLQDPVRLMLDRCLILCSGLSPLNAAAQCMQKPCRTREREEVRWVSRVLPPMTLRLQVGARMAIRTRTSSQASKTSRTVLVLILQTWSMKRMWAMPMARWA